MLLFKVENKIQTPSPTKREEAFSSTLQQTNKKKTKHEPNKKTKTTTTTFRTNSWIPNLRTKPYDKWCYR